MDQNNFWSYFLATAIGTLGFGLSLILYISNREQKYTSRLLAGFIFCITLTGINHVLLITDFYLFNPHLWRILVFTSLLHPSLSYLYVKGILEQQIKMKRWDWLYVLPATIYSAGYIPFYIKNIDEKKIIIKNILSNPISYSLEPEGILPPGIGVFLRLSFGIAMTLAQILLIKKWNKMIKETTKINDQNKEIINWLYFFSALLLLTYLMYFTISSLQIVGFTELFRGLAIIVFSCIASMAIYLLRKPNILNGLMGWFQAEILIPVDVNTKNKTTNPLLERTTISSAQKRIFKEKIELLFNQKKEFIQPGYKIRDLSNSLDIPIYLLSEFINQEFGLNFNEFINSYRIDYLTELIKRDGQINPDTIIKMKKMVGFESDNIFKLAIKKKTGMNSTEFFEYHNNI